MRHNTLADGVSLIGALPADLVWTGHATKTLNPSKDPEKNQKNMDKAMAKLLKDFPPKKS